jgi:hypothetical protein
VRQATGCEPLVQFLEGGKASYSSVIVVGARTPYKAPEALRGTRLAQYNRNRAFYGREAIRIGIGINSGEVITGSIGSEKRKDYTVIGDPVNVAARLQEFSKEARHSGIILSESTGKQVRSVAVLEPLEQRTIRGKAEQVQCYELVHVLAVDEILRKLRSGPGQERVEAFLGAQALPAAASTSGQRSAACSGIPRSRSWPAPSGHSRAPGTPGRSCRWPACSRRAILKCAR